MAWRGLSGGALGSSQSPSCIPESHTWSSAVSESTRSTQALAESYCRSRRPASPVARNSSQGTTAAASPHTAAGSGGVQKPPGMTGAYHGTVPWALCSMARSVSHEPSSPAQS